MSVLEKVTEKYAEAATTALPLRRLFVLLVGIILSILVPGNKYKSLFEGVMRTSFEQLVDLKKGFFSEAAISNLFFGVAAVVAGVLVSQLVLRLLFALVGKSLDYKKVVADAMAASPVAGLSVQEQKEMLDLINSITAEPRVKIKKKNSIAELCTGTSVAIVGAAYWGNILDVAVGVFLFVISIFLHISSIKIFLADVLGPTMLRSQLLGKSVPGLTVDD